VARKPLLSYKLSTATQKADVINVGSAEDWKGCLKEVNAAEKKKKGTVPVKIIIAEQASFIVKSRALEILTKPIVHELSSCHE
jgi:hypothetical protein